MLQAILSAILFIEDLFQFQTSSLLYPSTLAPLFYYITPVHTSPHLLDYWILTLGDYHLIVT